MFAAQALGMTYGQSMRLVILPQAFRNMVPLLLTQGIILFQDTSLVYVSDAVDALLQNNRNRLLAEFDSGRLRWSGGECKRDTRELPGALCESLQKRERQQLDLRERLVFYHFGFDDLLALDARHAGLKRKLD